ncbi:MAG: bifunctional 5,10-methylenetetrahydrofolate dehydrogenase/5,10-methenyltetrahydrofolate cyclohydrolase [Hamadaea sp.]|uniref:bifunctional 5,10-methylenetetrahydrofolate dehydrogenase/5,10-methenyltetrahydrofolate cyclohydrolase n=1 Tax=Hamadaea sp. TaxID=2024425 RepID=UPI0018289CE4|nr:bifunctional 5,10-methylenetetrahydrofolate dehydrogenase/5,10-methenyltetrahydrofolate cyclohydrolase [Hamadaea sp.]NUR71886.1 bifunctional 5,10-methylenetetrahydrofolate dehydrogenase/5,10-methenyltetrahydrofolate cyclohydrolase [Hamadaea sp.]NUT19906.1 bifunctional 5,10-methylenetetrahydrofolate dehydrogenase/5,10-methenyltetrahydrofolate cyclohydrolase [Hamadaea sp.]
MRLIDGKAHAARLGEEVSARAAELRSQGTDPTLAVVVPTDDEATAWYVRSIARTAEKTGVTCRIVHLDQPTGDEVAGTLAELGADPEVHGLICQTPLPAGVTLDQVGEHIPVAKDVDGANPASLGRLAAGLPAYAPATARAVLELLLAENVPLSGVAATVVGRSTVVGKPAALLLLAQNATVTVAHSRTRDLAAVCRQADVLVAAVGRAHLIGDEHIKPGAVVIDVGTNPTDDGGLTGDVDPAVTTAGALTPVPGGVGPVTTMLLLAQTLDAASVR